MHSDTLGLLHGSRQAQAGSAHWADTARATHESRQAQAARHRASQGLPSHLRQAQPRYGAAAACSSAAAPLTSAPLRSRNALSVWKTTTATRDSSLHPQT